MKQFLDIVALDYKQRTRNYTFLITLCASLAIAYTFIPEPDASYSTIRIADYIGYYNSAWFGYVTAIMASMLLSLVGFYLVNSGIKNDSSSKVGQIIASTEIKTSIYLLSKILSNLFILLTILVIIFTMSIVLFFLYNDGYSFEWFQFVKPYLIITVPALFFISSLAVAFEICFERYQTLQNVLFFVAFSALMVYTPKTETGFAADVFGSKVVINKLEQQVRTLAPIDDETDISIGYVLGNVQKASKFEFRGINFTDIFILSRIIWVGMGFVLVFVLSPLFHRFNVKTYRTVSKKNVNTIRNKLITDIDLNQMAKPNLSFSILPLLKTECLMLIRKGKKWLWLFNIIGMLLLVVFPLNIAHQMVLPIIWFFQVHRISDISTKEQFYKIHHFTFTAYKPIKRIMLSQVVSATLLMIVLALPLVVRLFLSLQLQEVCALILGAIFIIIVSALLGILSKGKKLFEILFFLVTYANINGIPALDYFGGFSDGYIYIAQLLAITLFLISMLIVVRRYLLKFS